MTRGGGRSPGRSDLVPVMAWRSVRRSWKRSAVTASSIALGLAFTIFYVAVQAGLEHRLTGETVRLGGGHITVEHPDYRASRLVGDHLPETASLRSGVEALGGVAATKLLVMGLALARSSGGSANVMVIGVEPGIETALSPLAGAIVSGRYLRDGDRAAVVIGRVTARQLKLREGGRMLLAAADAEGVLTETMARVAGIFDTGVEEMDGLVAQVPLGFARELFGLPDGAATQLAVVLREPRDQARLLRRIRALPEAAGAAAHPWQEVLPELGSIFLTIRFWLYILEALLIALVLFTIFNTVLMSMLEREKEFAVALALGTPARVLKRQIVLESAMLGGLGCAAGLLAGGLVSLGFKTHGLHLERLGGGELFFGFGAGAVIFPRPTPPMLAVLGGIVLAAAVAIGFAPARRVDRISLPETLR